MAEKNLISVVGPTAIGKTTLAIALAQYLGTEIISADSRQFFKEMSIGTAVPSREELALVPHHFIQHKSIHEKYSVGDFERDALDKLDRLLKDREYAVMVGGSGLYVDAVTTGLDHFPEVDPGIRKKLNSSLEQDGITALQEQLRSLDREYYAQVDPNNPRRLIRALEICIGTGVPYSFFLNQEKKTRSFNTVTIGLEADRQVIYERIDKRVDLMLGNGLLEEVKSLEKYKALNALQTVGYRELFRYLDGEFDLDTAIAEIKKNTRRFAKRQLTWLRKKEGIIWTGYRTDPKEVLHTIKLEIARK